MVVTPEWNRLSSLECGWRDSLMDHSNAIGSKTGLSGTQNHISLSAACDN